MKLSGYASTVLQKVSQFLVTDLSDLEDPGVCQYVAKKVQKSMDAAGEEAAKDSQDLQDELKRWITWAHRPAGTAGESVALLSDFEVPVVIDRLKELQGTLVPAARSSKVSFPTVDMHN